MIPGASQARRRAVGSLPVCLAAAALATGIAAGGPQPQEPAPPPDSSRSVVAVRLSSAVTLDGALDEPAWQAASPLTRFTQRHPAEGAPASQPTEVRILYDDEVLYIGAVLSDSQADRIVAREMKEDGDLDHDDLFGVVLDTFHDRRNGFYFETNPNGARGDALIYDEGRTRSFDWDGVWEVASRRTDRGWSTEMAIPFRTLHFNPDRTNPWGLQVWRFIRRNSEDVFWAPIPRNEDLFRISRAGELRGLEGIRQGHRIDLKPYALGALTRRPTLGERAADGRGDVGLDVRYDITPNLAAVATLNTDFAETEVDEQQVNTTRFPLFFPEKREFFLESTGYFEFGFNRSGPGSPPGLIPFFSRRVGLADDGTPLPILGGAKLVGRMGRYNLGAATVSTDRDVGRPQTNFSALRLSRDILTRSNWGVIGVSREPAGPDSLGDPNDPLDDVHSNRTWGADLNFSVLENLKFGGSLLQTRTPGRNGGEGAGHGYVYWSDNSWAMELSHRDIGRDFNPEAGFVRRTGIEETEAFLGWNWRSATAPVRLVEPHSRMIYTADQEHDLATRWHHIATTVEFRDGQSIEAAYNPQFDELTETFSLNGDDAVVPPGAYGMDQWYLRYDPNPSRVVSASFFGEWGDFFDGRFRSIEVTGRARISKYLRSSLSVLRQEYDLPRRSADPNDPASVALPSTEFNFTLVQARLGVTFTTRLYFDALVQYNTALDDLSANLRFNWKYRPGSDVYAVYTERRDIEGLPTDEVDRSVTVKWTYLLAF